MKTTEEVEAVLKKYGCPEYVLREYDIFPEQAQIEGGALWLVTKTGVRILMKSSAPEEKIHFQFAVTEHISRTYPYIPRFLRSKYSDPYVVTGNGIFYVTDGIPGEEPDMENERDLALAIHTLGRIHTAGMGFDLGTMPARKEIGPDLWHKTREKWKVYQEIIEEKGDISRFDQLFLDQVPKMEKAVMNAVDEWAQSAGDYRYARCIRDRWICHGHFHPTNVTIDGDRVWVSGFEHCDYGDPMHELADVLQRYMPKIDWNADTGMRALDGYERACPLDEDARYVLSIHLLLPGRIAQLTDWYYEGKRDWTEERFVQFFERALEQEESRESFVRRLSHRYQMRTLASEPIFRVQTAQEEQEREESSGVSAGTVQGENQWIKFEDQMKDMDMEIEHAVEENPIILVRNQPPRKKHKKPPVPKRPKKHSGPWVDSAIITRPQDPRDQ